MVLHRFLLVAIVAGGAWSVVPTDGVSDLNLTKPQEVPGASASSSSTSTTETATVAVAGPWEWLVEYYREETIREFEEGTEEAIETTWENAPNTEAKDEIEENEETREDPANTTEGWFEAAEDGREARFEADKAAGIITTNAAAAPEPVSVSSVTTPSGN
jgi:hypothetical protein